MTEFTYKDLETLAYELPDEINKYKLSGDFDAAAAALDRWLERPVAEVLKKRMRLEKTMLEQLPEQFPYTKEDALALFRVSIPDFGPEELERLDREGFAEWIFLNGEKHYIHNLVRNVYRMDAGIRARARGSADHGATDLPEKWNVQAAMQEMKQNGGCVRRVRLRASVRLRDDLFYPGIRLKAHLPVPAELHQISGVKILAHSDGKVAIDAPDSLCRTICIEDTLTENREFFVEYEYTVNAAYHDLSREEKCVQEFYRKGEQEAAGTFLSTGVQEQPDPSGFLGEQYPHIRFSPYLRALAAEIAGTEKRPLEIARRIYDYITKNVRYSFMREYFFIPDIPQYCARNLRGDCGVQALLFITLCRICGVPAKWQSGLDLADGKAGPHDWAMFYAKPYGWLFADPSLGGMAHREGDEERRVFYFGNLDPFRMAANNAFQQPFASPKHFLPNDPYDNQSGELESDTRGYRDREIHTEKILIDII